MEARPRVEDDVATVRIGRVPRPGIAHAAADPDSAAVKRSASSLAGRAWM
jgi:hypothetical protein